MLPSKEAAQTLFWPALDLLVNGLRDGKHDFFFNFLFFIEV